VNAGWTLVILAIGVVLLGFGALLGGRPGQVCTVLGTVAGGVALVLLAVPLL
jgi:hypothetical protein